MTLKTILFAVTVGLLCSPVTVTAQEKAEPHGWLDTETLKTRYGDFQFKRLSRRRHSRKAA